MTYQVHVLKMGEADVPGPEVYWMSHWEQWETLFLYMVVIRGNGTTLVINTGPPADLTMLNQIWRAFAGEKCYFKRAESERPEQALASIGVQPRDVDYVLLTPLQAYTTSNISLFSKAKICFSKRGWIEEIVAGPEYSKMLRGLCIPDEVLKHLLFEAWDRVKLLEDEDEICPGIRAWWAGTHHRSSMVYTVETAGGPVMIGDCAFKYGNLDGPPLGISESLAEGRRAYRRVKEGTAHFVPLYDPEVLQRYPDGRVA